MSIKQIALLIFAAVLCLGAGAYVIHQQENPPAHGIYSPVVNAAMPSTPASSNVQAYQPGCKKPLTREDADLCAQWAAVEAVGRGNNLTSLSIWLTFFEFIALAASLFFAAWAAIASARAAKASEQALTLAEQNAAAQIRPYLYFDGATSKMNEDDSVNHVQAFLKLTNFGSTPALNAQYSFVGNVVEYPLKDAALNKPFDFIGPKRRIPPNHFRHRWVYLSAAHYAAIQSGNYILLIRAEVTYDTSPTDRSERDFDRAVIVFDKDDLRNCTGRVPQSHDFASGSSQILDNFINAPAPA